MSSSTKELDGSARAGRPWPWVSRANSFYCTSEQMDLWLQVFAEADHRVNRLAASNNIAQERNQ